MDHLIVMNMNAIDTANQIKPEAVIAMPGLAGFDAIAIKQMRNAAQRF